MIAAYLMAVVSGSAVALVIWWIPIWLERCADKREMFAEAADGFFDSVTRLAKNDRTPDYPLKLLALIAMKMPDPKMIRFMLWRGVNGKLREHATHPTESMRNLRREMRDLPDELQTELTTALSYGLLANALAAGISGELFLRLMFLDPKGQKETATTFAAEMLACAEPQHLVAA